MLAAAVALASAPAIAQEVWQTYPMTISTPSFGPGPAAPIQVPAVKPAVRHLYNVVPAPQADLSRCEVWQTYPGTISTAANYIATDCE
jgi:hypothetical protein